MLNIPDSIKTLFRTDGVKKNFRAHFPNGEYADITNENVVQESLKFTESLCSQDQFRFGLAEASVLEFETVGIGNMYGMTIEAAIEIDTTSLSAAQISAIEADPGDGTLVKTADSDLGYGFFRVPLGVFRVEDCPRNHGAMTHRHVTAYSLENETPYSTFPYNLLSSSLNISLNGVLALVTGDGLAELTPEAPYRPPYSGYLIDTEITFSGYGENYKKFDVWLCCGTHESPTYALGSVNLSGCEVAKVEGVNSPVEIGRLRAAISDALDTAGYDLTYVSGVKKYQTNKEFIESNGRLAVNAVNSFRTVIDFAASGSQQPGDVAFVWSVPGTEYNTYIPVLSRTSGAFVCNDFPQVAGVSSVGFVRTIQNALLLTTEDDLFLVVRVTNAGAGNGTFYVDLPHLSEDLNITQVRRYTVSSPSPYITVNNAGAETVTKDWVTVTKYFYPERGGLPEIFKGGLEVFGLFYKDDRKGGRKILRLDPSTSIPITADDYAEVWWDEYDISPIGMVTVRYRTGESGEADGDVSLGDGLSKYDMTDNSALKGIEAYTLDDISALLSGDFATNAANVGFTPVDMTMRGLPWIEAGDALEITAEDGTVVDTYALRVEMNGIQHLTATIEAKGGTIIGEV